MDLSGFSLNSITSAANELRAAYYPRNETERKVRIAIISHFQSNGTNTLRS